MRTKQACAAALFLTFLLLPVAAHADAGTPLMWVGMFHLAILNFGIGILEGSVLARLFRLPKLSTAGWLIPANYLSAFAGFLLLRAAWNPLMHLRPDLPPLLKAGPLLFALVAASFLLSVLLEWPFCAWAMRSVQGGWRISLRASFIAQAASYVLLIPFYLLVSPISLLTAAHLDKNLGFVRTPMATVFYINPLDGSVWRIQTNGTRKRKVLDATIHDPDTRLFVRLNPKSHQYDLYDVRRLPHVYGPDELQETKLISNVGTGCAPSPHGREAETWFNCGKPADLRPKSQRKLTVSTEFWANEGISIIPGDPAEKWNKKKDYTLAFETPFADWICRNATVLPSDQIVFQLGRSKDDGQIVILDMVQKRLGFLTMGQGPIVVLSPASL